MRCGLVQIQLVGTHGIGGGKVRSCSGACAAPTAPILQVNKVCATANDVNDILTANLRLAEDRVISYLIILRSPRPGRSE